MDRTDKTGRQNRQKRWMEQTTQADGMDKTDGQKRQDGQIEKSKWMDKTDGMDRRRNGEDKWTTVKTDGQNR